MRPIDADALIEKCGDWYVEEGTESGFIGTLKNLLATEPTIQPQSTTGQLNDGAQSTAQSTDLIDRGQAIEKFTMTAPQMSVIRIYEAVEILESMPTIQPVATDAISRQAAIDALMPIYKSASLRNRNVFSTARKCMAAIEDLPSAQPERQRGEWIEISSINHTYKCSECGRLLVNITDGRNNVSKHYPYCHCGADMRGEQQK